MIRELDTVVLLEDDETHDLRLGDIGVVVHAYQDGAAYEVEFITGSGETIAVLTLKSDAVRPLRAHEILHARELSFS